MSKKKTNKTQNFKIHGSSHLIQLVLYNLYNTNKVLNSYQMSR